MRDAPDLKILECNDCGLVYLDSQDHINDKFYEQSGMHESESNLNDTCPSQILPIDSWLKGCEWDDSRRLEMSKPFLFEKKLLDFGCGSGGFLKKAQKLARVAEGVERATDSCILAGTNPNLSRCRFSGWRSMMSLLLLCN